MMKQFLMSVAVLGAAVTLAAPAVHADATFAGKTGTTDVTFQGDTTTKPGTTDPKAPDNGATVGGLTLTAVPSFSFKDAGATPKITEASTKVLTANGVSTQPTGDTTGTNNTSSSIYVRDTRGLTADAAGAGYSIYASASQLKAGDQVLPVASLNMTVADGTANSNGGLITGKSAVSVYQANNSVLKGGTAKTAGDATLGTVAGYGNLIAKGDGKTNGDNATGAVSAELNLSSNAVQAQKYTGTMYYTLVDSATSAN